MFECVCVCINLYMCMHVLCVQMRQKLSDICNKMHFLFMVIPSMET